MVHTDGAQHKYTVLVIAAHPDDEAIGPGATLTTLASHPGIAVYVVLVAADKEVRRAESRLGVRLLGLDPGNLLFAKLPDGQLASHLPEMRGLFRLLRDALHPSLVITHRVDAHPDHGAICQAVLNVFGHATGTSILHFKIPQNLATAWCPNAYVRLSRTAVKRKLLSFSAYRSQARKSYFDAEMHRGLLAEAGQSAASEYAEPFETQQMFLTPPSSGSVMGLAPVKPYAPRTDGNGHAGTHGASALIRIDGQDARVVLETSHSGRSPLVLASQAD